MLLAEDGSRSLLYTGDFKLGHSVTAEPAELPRANVLVMESTYGEPHYRRAPRQQLIDRLLEAVRYALSCERPPVIQAYALGKAQEVTRLLCDAGIPVLQHKAVFEISQIYQALGVSLGPCELYPGYWKAGHAVVVPPRFHKAPHLPGLRRAFRIAVTGWAQHGEGTFLRWGVDEAIPLSDHADYGELLEAVERVSPNVVYCTHGPASFVDRLREAGHNAYPLERPVGTTVYERLLFR